ncbi:MAG: PHP domain-containing protein [Candidatus Hermodarchaeota archaeon]
MVSNYSDSDWKDVIPYVPPGFDKNKYNLIFDQHSHTIFSDGKLTVKQNVEWHIAMGYNALAITDHNDMRHLEVIEEVKKEYSNQNIVIISGMEWSTRRIHLNFIGISEWYLKIPMKPKDRHIIDAISEAHNQGGVVVCDHIPWSINEFNMKTHPSRETLLEWEVDFFEIVNDDSLPENVYDKETYDFCKRHKGEVGVLTGTDMHKPDGLVGGGVHGWTVMNVPEFTEDAVMNELYKKRTEIIYSEIPYLDPSIHKMKR